MERVSDDAQMLVMAGTLTTGSTLELITFWLLSQPATLQKLKDELRAAIPNPEDVCSIPLPTLEALPYLTAMIKEGLRLSYGVSCRLARIDPDNAIVFTDKSTGKKWVIPADTPVGSTSVLIHQNEDIFPEHRKFSPERWLGSQGRELERFLLYLALTAVWRLWGSDGGEEGRVCASNDLGIMSLWETGLRDVEIESDQFVPVPQKGSKGIRVLVKG